MPVAHVERLPLTEVNGLIFFGGFVAFLVVVGVLVLIGIWVRNTNEETVRLRDEDEFFKRIEEFRNDFQ